MSDSDTGLLETLRAALAPEYEVERVLGAGDLIMLAIGAVIGGASYPRAWLVGVSIVGIDKVGGAYYKTKLAQEAAAKRKNLWNPTGCGTGPAPTAAFSMKLKWDADGGPGGVPDEKNVNGEWVRLSNPTAAPVAIGNWWLRDSHFRGPRAGNFKGRGYQLPKNAVIPAAGSIRVHVGRGGNSASEFYFGLSETIFENASNDKKKAGDGAYLFDPKGNLRAHSMYPCRAGNCSDPLAGKVQVTARYQGEADVYEPSSDVQNFVVEEEDTALALALSGKGSKSTLTATLTDADDAATGIADASIALFADGEPIGTVVTDGGGTAVAEVPPRYRSSKVVFDAVYDGSTDPFWLGSTGSTRRFSPRD